MEKVKSVNLMITNRCNSRCNMCNIWKNQVYEDIDLLSLLKLFSREEFSDVQDLSISGGEPLLKKDINIFATSLVRLNHNLKLFFVNSNGLLPKKTFELAKELVSTARIVNPELKVVFSISVEGPKEIHERIRGRSYDVAIETICLLQTLSSDKFEVLVSMTIQKENANHIIDVRSLAKSLGGGFTFRFADFSDNYYQNCQSVNIALTNKECINVLNDVKKYFIGDAFFKILFNYVCSGVNSVMFDSQNKFVCRAGKIFVFIKSNGNIHPCIYSNQIIGNIENGISPFTLQKLKSCPCCTECNVYPMLLYGNNKT
ncbi:MAG: Radical SAM [uncultured bacterium (gcode 4)]|uniref:Radical SAM n=1 Tax=uncultured bacterium (gcode 4) TaxID=1234023 RepID=K1Z509_9BACT|nr:MAG: Radical SAM [uncultured bacterium (gcode 4)]